MVAVGAVGGGDAVGAGPLGGEGAPGVEDAVFGIVDVGRFGGDAVEFDDMEILAALEGFEGGAADVVAAEVEAWKVFAGVVNGGFHGVGAGVAGV